MNDDFVLFVCPVFAPEVAIYYFSANIYIM